MKQLGLYLGAMKAELFGDVLLHCFSDDTGRIRGLYRASADSECITDFYTRFEDGHSLTTTTAESQSTSTGARGDKAYTFSCPGHSVDALLISHREELEKCIATHGFVMGRPVTLEAFAEDLDEYLLRMISGGFA